VTSESIATLKSVAEQTKENQMPEKTWKISDLWTDAQGKLDEKRILGMLFALAALTHVFIFADLPVFGGIAGASAAYLGGAVAADQGK